MYLYRGETPIKIYRGKYDIPKIYKGETLLCDENTNIEPYKKISQIIANGDFSNGSTGWTGVTTSASIVGGRLYNNGTNGANKLVYQYNMIVPNRRYYCKMEYEITSGTIALGLSSQTVEGAGVGSRSWVYTSPTANAIVIFYAGAVAYIDNVMFVDLTAAFGAGNEPTKAEMDDWFNNVGYFEGSKMF